MKKLKISFVFSLVLLIALVGWQNKATGQVPHNTTLYASPKKQYVTTEMTSIGESNSAEDQLTVADAGCTDDLRLVREYQDLGITIDAVCPTITAVEELPYLTAHFSATHFSNMLQDFLKQFPEAEEVENNP